MRCKKIRTILKYLIIALTIIMVGGKNVYAKESSEVSIYLGDYKKLSVDTSCNVRWRINKSKYLNYKVSDDKKSIVVIGKKSGEAKITAKYGKKTKVWKVKIKKEKNSHLNIKRIRKTGNKVVLTLNASIYAKNKDLNFEYGKSFDLYKYDGSKFKKIAFEDEFSFDGTVSACSVKKGRVLNKKIKYTLKKEYFKNWNLEGGLYKIVCDTSLSRKREYVLFEIK